MTSNRLRDTQGSIGVTLDPNGAITIKIRHYILLDTFFCLWVSVVVIIFVKIKRALVVDFQTIRIKYFTNTLIFKSYVYDLVSGSRDILPIVFGI